MASTRRNWPLLPLETGVALTLLGLLALNFDPFSSLYGVALTNWRVVWWTTGGQIIVGAGLALVFLGFIAAIAALAALCLRNAVWPYVVAGLGIVGIVIWVAPNGFTRAATAHFEWNASEGFTTFRIDGDMPANNMGRLAHAAWTEIVAAQVEPLLQNYFKANDWQKMNGDEDLLVARIIPFGAPVALGSGETLEDPDETPLMKAAANGNQNAIEELLSSGANINVQDQGGQTALMYVCRSAKPSAAVVKLLLASGADVNVRSHSGYTALLWAQTKNDREIIRLLKNAGAKP
jgi:hypothetical protein